MEGSEATTREGLMGPGDRYRHFLGIAVLGPISYVSVTSLNRKSSSVSCFLAIELISMFQ